MASLYEMSEQAAALYELLQSEEIDEQTYSDTLEGMGAVDKCENYCKIIKQFQGDIEMYKTELARLQNRKKTAENAIERMKDTLVKFMTDSGQKKLDAGLFTVSTSTSRAVNITDVSLIPSDFLIAQPAKVDKENIKKALLAGQEITGAELLENTGVRIR